MNFMRRRAIAAAAASCASGLLSPLAALAQPAWPTRPVKLVTMGPPGTAPDVFCRVYADHLSKALGVTVIVDNRPGVAGNLASEVVAKSPADGYTFLYNVSNAFTINPAIYKKLNFDPEKDFRAVAPLLSSGAFIIANNDLPIKTVPELVAYAKSHPGKLAYGTNGIGSFLHLIMELFDQSANVTMLHVPYKGATTLDLISGQIQLAVEPAGSAIPMIKAGKVRAIAFSGPNRHPQLPDVPTIAETYPGLAVTGWHGLWAPAGVPTEVVQRMNAEVTRVTKLPEVRKVITDLGAEPLTMSADAMAAMVRSEKKVWGDLARAKNITVD